MSNQKRETGNSRQNSSRDPRLLNRINKLVLLFPILVAVALHFSGQGIGTALALDYQKTAFYQFYTAAYVHATNSHLVNNLVGYVLSVPPLYALYVHQNRRHEFFAAFTFIILAVPVIANVASYLTWGVFLDLSIQYGRGLSGVVAAFVGLLLMHILGTYDEELPEENAIYAASMVGIILFATWAVMFRGLNRLVALVMLGAVLTLVVYASWRGNFAAAGLVEWARDNQRLALILLFGTFAALYMVVISFPADLQNRGGFTNLVGHGAGFFTGMAIHYWQSR